MQSIVNAEYSRTPTPLPPAPRVVRARKGELKGIGIWAGRLFIIPHTLVGVGAILYLVFVLAVKFLGKDVTGQVTGGDVRPGQKRPVYTIRYRYEMDGVAHEESEAVDALTYQELNPPAPLPPVEQPAAAKPGKNGRKAAQPAALAPRPPQQVMVHYFNWGPIHRASRVTGESFWETLSGLIFFVCFWNGIMLVFVYVFWIQPIRDRRLVKHGAAMAGVISEKLTWTRKGRAYYRLRYRYEDPATGREIKRERACSNRAFSIAEVNEAVTVVYDPRKPKRSVLYEYGAWEVEFPQVAGASLLA